MAGADCLNCVYAENGECIQQSGTLFLNNRAASTTASHHKVAVLLWSWGSCTSIRDCSTDSLWFGTWQKHFSHWLSILFLVNPQTGHWYLTYSQWIPTIFQPCYISREHGRVHWKCRSSMPTSTQGWRSINQEIHEQYVVMQQEL